MWANCMPRLSFNSVALIILKIDVQFKFMFPTFMDDTMLPRWSVSCFPIVTSFLSTEIDI